MVRDTIIYSFHVCSFIISTRGGPRPVVNDLIFWQFGDR
jgi:hypothetical protein